jgi:hypothetical protein
LIFEVKYRAGIKSLATKSMNDVYASCKTAGPMAALSEIKSAAFEGRKIKADAVISADALLAYKEAILAIAEEISTPVESKAA